MKRGISIFIFATLIVIFFLTSHKISGIIKPKSLEERIDEAHMIIVGEVLEVRSEWNADRSIIFTYVTVSVEEYIKGSYLLKEIKVKILGGIVDGIGAWVPDTPSFSKGEKVLLFLRPDRYSECFWVVNQVYGKLTVTKENKIIGYGVSLEEFTHRIKEHIAKKK